MDILRRFLHENMARIKWENRFDEIIYGMYKNGKKLPGEVFAPRDLMNYQHCQEKRVL